MKRTLPAAIAALSLLSCVAFSAHAQTYPAKSVTVVVAYPPGGGPDILARSLAEKLTQRLGQTVVVENKPGASGMIGAAQVARSPADGYTLLMAPNTFLIAPQVMTKGIAAQVDVLKDFTPIIEPSRGTMILAVHPSLGVKNAKELAALLKKEPGMGYATPGSGSPMHIAGELFKQAAGVDMTHVPYKGVAPAINDTVGGQVKIVYSALGAIGQYIASGRLIALAAVSKDRSPLMPELSTMAEQGFPSVEVNVWYGIYAPKNTPKPIVDKLNQEVNEILKTPDMIARMKTSWEVPVGGTPEALAAQSQREYVTFGKVIKEFNITAD